MKCICEACCNLQVLVGEKWSTASYQFARLPAGASSLPGLASWLIAGFGGASPNPIADLLLYSVAR